MKLPKNTRDVYIEYQKMSNTWRILYAQRK